MFAMFIDRTDKVNNAENVAALDGISYVTMLLDQFKAVTYGSHSGIAVTEKINTLQGLVNRYNALDDDGKAAVLQKVFEGKPYARSQATTEALAVTLTEVETEINARLTITSVSVVDNKAYASTAADGGTVRVLGYGVGINLNADSSSKKVSDTTSIVIELYNGDTLLGQQTFSQAGYTKHADKSAISGTIDAGGEYIATSWDNSWDARIDDIPDKAVATVQYKDGTATAEKALSLSDDATKIFFAAEAVYALFTDPLANVENLTLTEGVTKNAIDVAETKVTAAGEGSSHKTLFGEMTNKANALLGGDEGTQEANIEMMQFVPEKPVAEKPLETEDEIEAAAEETTESDEATTDGAVENEVNEEEVATTATEEPVSEPEVEDEEDVVDEEETA